MHSQFYCSNGFYPPPPPLAEPNRFETECNVNIEYGNLKLELGTRKIMSRNLNEIVCS
jgi:hypothetical protein